MSRPELRKDRRLELNLPIRYRPARDTAATHIGRSRNISTGGMYFQGQAGTVETGQQVWIQMTIPPGEGHLPYDSSIQTIGRVLRIERLSEAESESEQAGIAIQFVEPLKVTV